VSLHYNPPMTDYYKYLGVDLGEKRIGLALTDGLRLVAEPWGMFNRTSRVADFAYLQKVVVEQNVRLLVFGLPVTLGGEEGRMAAWVREYATAVSTALNLPVTFWDESLTSQAAERSLREQGLNSKQMKAHVDAVAAALMLQSYLEAHRERDQNDSYANEDGWFDE
jgi:putative holliday junction resolvase